MSRGLAVKLGLLGSLYFSQGLPFGFFTQAMPVLLRKQGYSLGESGLASLLAMPWALKFLWVPAVDRFWLPAVGARGSWILPLQGLSVAALIGRLGRRRALVAFGLLQAATVAGYAWLAHSHPTREWITCSAAASTSRVGWRPRRSSPACWTGAGRARTPPTTPPRRARW